MHPHTHPHDPSESIDIITLVLRTVSAVSSIVGSSLIVYVMLHYPGKLQNTKNRLLLTMSSINIFHSVFIALGPLCLQNHILCQAQGTAMVFGISVPFYNASEYYFEN